jgi:hypothetical protein
VKYTIALENNTQTPAISSYCTVFFPFFLRISSFSLLFFSFSLLFFILVQGYIFRSEKDVYSPSPSENDILSPLRNTSFFDSHRGLFAFILPYFPFILPSYFPFSHFLSPFFLFISLFFRVFYIFPLFLFPFSYFFPQMTSADILPRGGGVFSNI